MNWVVVASGGILLLTLILGFVNRDTGKFEKSGWLAVGVITVAAVLVLASTLLQ